MTLSRHVNSSKLENKLLKRSARLNLTNQEEYISKYNSNVAIPKYRIPETSTNSELIYKLIQSDLTLDGNPTLNLASFVNTDIDEIALKLITENVVKNLADNDEYPSLIEFHKRCVSILADLWHAPKSRKVSANTEQEDDGEYSTAIGTATTGSSEAILLAGLAMKKKWQERQVANGESTKKPNIIMASCVQVALEKFARYFDVENRLINVSQASHHLIDVGEITKNCDKNTIGIFVILGSTFTGGFEPIYEISQHLDTLQEETGLNIPIHVDGASGGFVAPFAFPNLKWDFQIDRVVSINTSGHKFGLTTAGLGWIIWRDVAYLPESLRFKLDYLGGVEETFTLNFSRPGFPVIIQYFNFLRYGREGYTKIFDSCLQNARLLSDFLEQSQYFDVVSNIHKKADSTLFNKITTSTSVNEKYNAGLPVVAFKLSEKFTKNYPEIPQSIVSAFLRNKGFIVPNYKLPPSETSTEILRVVIRDSFNLDLLDKLTSSLVDIIELLIKSVDIVRTVGINQYHKGEKGSKTQKATINYDNIEELHSLLLSIATAGMEDSKNVKSEHTESRRNDKGKKLTKSYRGTC